MRRLVPTGLVICGASLLLFLLSAPPARAEADVATPARAATAPAPKPAHAAAIAHAKAKAKLAAHAGHRKPAPRKFAAAHRKPPRKNVAEHARPTAKKPAGPAVPTAVARNRPVPAAPAPVIRVSARWARPAPAEAAIADRLAASPLQPAPAADASASRFVIAFLTDAFRIARTMDDAPDKRRAELAELMATRMDLSRILIYATHAAFQSAPAAMQQQFRLSFANFLAEAYTPRIKLAAELAFTTAAPRPSDGGVSVSTTFTKPGYPASTIDWQLEPSGNSFKIVDVGSEGVSLLAIQRSSFTSVMLNDGGLQGLLGKMDARTRELASAAK